jgi:hypothetical protein
VRKGGIHQKGKKQKVQKQKKNKIIKTNYSLGQLAPFDSPLLEAVALGSPVGTPRKESEQARLAIPEH